MGFLNVFVSPRCHIRIKTRVVVFTFPNKRKGPLHDGRIGSQEKELIRNVLFLVVITPKPMCFLHLFITKEKVSVRVLTSVGEPCKVESWSYVLVNSSDTLWLPLVLTVSIFLITCTFLSPCLLSVRPNTIQLNQYVFGTQGLRVRDVPELHRTRVYLTTLETFRRHLRVGSNRPPTLLSVYERYSKENTRVKPLLCEHRSVEVVQGISGLERTWKWRVEEGVNTL